jgi:hypothetical protein
MATTIKLNRMRTHAELQTETFRLSAETNTRLTLETVLLALLALARQYPAEMLRITNEIQASLYGPPEVK